ncbi:hypothetical protein [Tabrizicola sp. BL-A-41-H6]|uniref:hypothetical protein n=1 Tax=Tabrizicola sp. BL-A-41-H6 TaxID=3421107 RepID=UPI003D6664C3
MQKQKADGAVFGNPDIMNVQRLGEKALSTIADALVQSIADVLRSIPDRDQLSRAEVAGLLNARGMVTGAGYNWTAERVTATSRKARLLLSEEAPAPIKALPTYGPL